MDFLEILLYLSVVILLAIPLGIYIERIMNNKRVFLTRLFKPLENLIYKLLKVNSDEDMTWRKYLISLLAFSLGGFLFLFILLLLQGVLPGNPERIHGMSWHLAFNTAISYVTNTNWQSYTGETQVSYLSQAIGLTVQNFVSAAAGIAVLFALIRGFIRTGAKGIGSFWADITRIILYILLPLSLVSSILLVSQGVVQTIRPYGTVQLLEPVAIDSEGDIVQDAVIENGKVHVYGKEIEDARLITREMMPTGIAASQVAIKQLGTNGGGYFGANSAHPLENPTWLSNLIEMISILLIPASLCFTFGRAIGDRRQGIAIFMAMAIILCSALAAVYANERSGITALTRSDAVYTGMQGQSGGNMEGKESRFGIAASSVWSVFTTCASNGSVNSMLDSYTPLGGMLCMLLIQLGEVVFGGAGSGLYGMLGFAILTVFIAGLMVGRTPEYLGKKIEPFEMKWAVIICLATPIAILLGSGIAAALPDITSSLGASGAHGFSQLLYAFSSAGGNNGSAFGGFSPNTATINILLALCMAFGRFIPMAGALAIGGSLAMKKKLASTAGTLSTSNGAFVFLLIFVVLLIGALSFFPALSLGPLAEYFSIR